MKHVLIPALLLFSVVAWGQVGINSNGAPPHASAMLEVQSTDKGLLPPRLSSAQRDAIVAPAAGLRIYNTDSNCENFFNGSNWMEICGNCIPAPTASDAGADQPDLSGTSATLAANPPVSGTGTWSVISGAGGSFDDEGQPNTQFNGVAGNDYTLRWTISTLCGNSTDDVFVSFVLPFTCGTNTVSDVESNVYNTVSIGGLCWMKENLKTTKYRNNSSIEYPGSNNSAWSDNTAGAYAWYNNNSGNSSTYGALYNWHAVDNVAGLCPTGWHVPTDDEWKTTEIALGMSSMQADDTGFRGTDEGNKMKTTGNGAAPLWASPSAGTNSSGFTAIPSGWRDLDGAFYGLGTTGWWWTSSPNSGFPWLRIIESYDARVSRNTSPPARAAAVRCIKD